MPSIRLSIMVASVATILTMNAVVAADPPPVPTPHPPSALAGTSLTWCGDTEQIYAAPDVYRDDPIYVGNEQPTARIVRWARKQPGYVDVWLDRDHLGWITLAFTQDADQRQADLERLFPAVGAVAVPVEHSRQELKKLRRRVQREMTDYLDDYSLSTNTTGNVVELGVGILTDEVAAELESRFAGDPLCISGADATDFPAAGPQPTSGDGWVMLGWEQGAGPAHRTGIASDQASYEALWKATGLSDPAPDVDFLNDVVVWFALGHGSSCPDLRMDEVIVDTERAQVYPFVVMPGRPMMCTDDLAGAYQFVAALQRSALPVGPFEIGLDGGRDRQLFRSLQVETDLSVPGAVASGDEVRKPRSGPARSGIIVETIGKSAYAFDASCGIGYLGVINDTHWVTEEEMPNAWAGAVAENGNLVVTVRLRTRPGPHIKATAGGQTVVYQPTVGEPPECQG